MKKILSAFLLTVLTAAAAGAQEAPAIFGKMKPKVGAWAQYSFATKKGDQEKTKGRFRMSVVGKQGDSLWIEQKFALEDPKPKKDAAGGVMKFLMGKDGVEKAYMKTERGVMDMSGMMASGSRKKQAAVDKMKMTEVGSEKIEVPAGKYKATHYTFEDGKNSGDSWMKPGVGPYGMIKQVHRDGKLVSTLELLSSGDDAKSEVDEKTAQSMFGAMMDRPSRAKAGKGHDAASDEKAPEAPSLGGMFRNALKKKAGLGGD